MREKTLWESKVGRKVPRPRSRWQRQRLIRQARHVNYEIGCDLCLQYGSERDRDWGTDRALHAHQWAKHRGVYLRRALLQVEQKARRDQRYGLRDDAAAWACHPLARRYRRLMKLWWTLDKAEYSRAMGWSPDEGLPEPAPYLTRVGEPTRGATQGQSGGYGWYTQPWLKAVEKHWPEKWPAVKAAYQARERR